MERHVKLIMPKISYFGCNDPLDLPVFAAVLEDLNARIVLTNSNLQDKK